MAKLCNLLDEIPELDKRVYAVRLLVDQDVSQLDDREFNCWLGLLLDSVSLLEQSASDVRRIASALDAES